MHKILKHLQGNQTVKLVFRPAHFVSFSIARNFQSYLVRSKLYPLQHRNGLYKCNTPRCGVGKNIKES